MKRHVSIRLGGAALVLLALLTVGASTAFAKTWKCMVINDRINTTYMVRWPDSMNPVQDAIDEAAPWDTLWIRGECPGTLEITKSLTLEGQEVAGFRNAPTIRAKDSTPSNRNNVVHVSGSGVQVQINSLILTGGGNKLYPVEHGGGILNEQAELTLNNVTITGNYARRGGGIYNHHGTVELTGSTIDSNFAGENAGRILDRGGGIYTTYGTVILNASTITNNQGALSGGGIYAWAATVVANGSEIAYNFTVLPHDQFVYPNYGGGIYVDSNSGEPWNTLTLTDTTIHDNFAELAGGGIWATRADITLTGSSELSGNHTNKAGGGAYVRGNLVLSGDTTIHDNTAIASYYYPGQGFGGGVAFGPVYISDRFTMSGNATIYDNAASIRGGGIIGLAGFLINCISGTEGDEGVNVFNNDPDNINY